MNDTIATIMVVVTLLTLLTLLAVASRAIRGPARLPIVLALLLQLIGPTLEFFPLGTTGWMIALFGGHLSWLITLGLLGWAAWLLFRRQPPRRATQPPTPEEVAEAWRRQGPQ